MPTVDKNNLHRASSKVELSYYVAPKPPAGRYQETWVDRNVSQQTTQTGRVVGVEHWKGGWDTSTKKLSSVPQFNGVVLDCNRTPDAPRHTLVYGKARFYGEGTALNNIYVAHKGLRPEKYAATPAGGSVIPPGADGGTASWNADNTPAQPFPNTDVGLRATANLSSKAVKEKFHQDTPFIPSKMGNVTNNGGIRQWYSDNIYKDWGLRLWNVWNLVSPSEAEDGRVYYENYGPVWTKSNYAGATLQQDFTEGILRVKINASMSRAIVERLAPIEKDIGRDPHYPWIFPYIDANGQVNHSIMATVGPTPAGPSPWTSDGQKCEKALKSDSLDHETDVDNQGFIMNLDITTQSDRGNFLGQGGGTPSVTVTWGGGADLGGTWLTEFSVQLIPNKRPSLTYNDSQGTQEIFLSTSEVPDGSITLRVQYLGPHMLVVLNENISEAKFIRGQSDAATGSLNPRGVHVTTNKVRLVVENCTVSFDFQPAYANPWDPSQVIGGGWTGEGSSNWDFHAKENGSETENASFVNGMVKFEGLSNLAFNFNGHDANSVSGNAEKVYQSLRDAVYGNGKYSNQTLYGTEVTHPTQQVARLNTNYGSEVRTVDSQTLDYDTPMIVLDWRHELPKPGNPGNVPVRFLGYKSGTPAQTARAAGDPYEDDDQVGFISTLVRVNTTHTSPIIIGFKAPATSEPQWPSEAQETTPQSPQPGSSSLSTLSTGGGSGGSTGSTNKAASEDISQYVESWKIDWKEDAEGKVLRATATLTLLNPPTWMIRALTNNILKVRIHSTGYQINSTHGSFTPRIKQALFSAEPIFEGFTTEVQEGDQSGGEHRVMVVCSDPIGMLESSILETNFRMDGCSILLSFCSLMKHSNFSNRFAVIPYAGYDESKGQPYYRWLQGPTTADWFSNIGLASRYGMICFGYEPLASKSHEINVGAVLYEELKKLLSCMDDPMVRPIFYYDPKKARFTLAFRQAKNTVGRLVVSSVPQDMNSALPLISSASGEGGGFYVKRSVVDNIKTHYTLIGSSRLDGTPMKQTVTNPNWRGLEGKGLKDAGQGVMGHTGFLRRILDAKTEQMFADQKNLKKAAVQRMWWIMRPVWYIGQMKVLGLVMPNSDDVTVTVKIENRSYDVAFLGSSSIEYDNKEGTLTSTFDVKIWPLNDADLSSMNERFGGR